MADVIARSDVDNAGAVGRGGQDPVSAQVSSSAMERPGTGEKGARAAMTAWSRCPTGSARPSTAGRSATSRSSCRRPASSAGRGPTGSSPPALSTVDDVRFETQGGASQSLGAFLMSTSTDAFIAVRRGRVAAELYFDGMTPSTRHLLQSVSKSLCGTVAGVLIGTGELRADDPVTGHVPELAATSFEGATVRHLLDMTAGTRFLEDYDDPAADVRAYERAAGWQAAAPGEDELT